MKGLWRLAVLAGTAGLASCAISIDDTVRGNFSDIQPGAVPPAMIGNWTGELGKNLVTLQLQPDGNGVSCGTWSQKETQQAIKHLDGKLFFQDGTRAVLSQDAPESIQLLRAYSGDESARLLRDPDLQKASPACAQLIRG